MLTLQNIMTTDLLVLAPETTIRQAMEALGRRQVSGAPVVRDGRLVGVVSTSDLLTFAATLPETTDDSVATPGLEEDDAALVPEGDGDDPASAYFWEWWEDTDADASERMSSVDTAQLLDRHVVEEVMTHTPLLTLPPSATIEHAARVMETARVHRVLVTEGAKLVGLVTSFDIAKAVGEERLTRRVYVFGRAGPSSRTLVC